MFEKNKNTIGNYNANILYYGYASLVFPDYVIYFYLRELVPIE